LWAPGSSAAASAATWARVGARVGTGDGVKHGVPTEFESPDVTSTMLMLSMSVPKSVGRSLQKVLSCMYRNDLSSVSAPICVGNVPCNSFDWRKRRVSSIVSRPSSVGTASRWARLTLSSDVNWLSFSSSCLSIAVSRPSCVGITPVKAFDCSFSWPVSAVRRPISEGSAPAKSFSKR
jgi:hypothetical protein